VVSRFVDRDMMMQYYWGYGVGHMYAFTLDLSQGNCLQLAHDNDSNILGDSGRTYYDTAKMDDEPGDESDGLSWSDDDELQDGHCNDADEVQDLVNAMYYNSDPHAQDESSWDREYYEF